MGQSTNGILFFGFDLGEDFETPWEEDDMEFEDYYYDKMREKYPDKYPERVRWDRNDEQFSAYVSAKEKLIEDTCIVDIHCSCEYPVYYVAISEANFIMWAGILFSLPLGLFISILSGEWIFFFSVFLLGCMDLSWIFVFYQEKKKNPFFNELNKNHAIVFKVEFKEVFLNEWWKRFKGKEKGTGKA